MKKNRLVLLFMSLALIFGLSLPLANYASASSKVVDYKPAPTGTKKQKKAQYNEDIAYYESQLTWLKSENKKKGLYKEDIEITEAILDYLNEQYKKL
ncbi:hypothetical protein [Paenibacillus polymyxa]|uniref:hypothetical protein n=1 Tax=Paenibacillus polymyxa TaxID=1406 RepID=UPI0023797909|nr:hypothetical protein [Paenibacillus polymyxa]WDM22655.1 hypothetical protein J4I02_03270 [Paenibacillus polymyxa]